jgi:hypothetical protein
MFYYISNKDKRNEVINSSIVEIQTNGLVLKELLLLP